MFHSSTPAFCHKLTCRANAWAALRGGWESPDLLGCVKFFQTQAGVLALAEVWGLPRDGPGVPALSFRDGMGPALPPLAAGSGYVWTASLLPGASVRELLGRTVALEKGEAVLATGAVQ